MEAMACGCCAVASEVGGNPEFVERGETGLLFPPGDSQALAAVPLESLAARQALRTRLSEAGGAFIRGEFSRAAAARRMGQIYADFLHVAE